MPEFEPARAIVETDDDRPADVISFETDQRTPPTVQVLGIALALAVTMGGDTATHWPEVPEATVSSEWDVPADAPRLTPVSGRPAVDFPSLTLDLPGAIVEFDQAPQGYAVVAAQDCRTGPECRVILATSHRPGRWTKHLIPKDATRNGGSPRPRVLDTGMLVLENYGEQTPGGWYSADDGETWLPVPSFQRPPLPAASDRRLDLKRAGLPTGPCGGRHVAGYLRGSGELVPLRTQPEVQACAVPPFPDPYGRRWVAGTVPGGAAVAMSTDEGRTWTRSVLPGTRTARYVEVALTGQHAYAVVFGNPAGASRLVVTGVFRHDDRGWSVVWRPGATPAWVGQVTVCPEGLRLIPAGYPDSPDDRLTGAGWDQPNGFPGLPTVLASAVPGRGWIGWYLTRTSVRPVYSYDCHAWHGLTVG